MWWRSWGQQRAIRPDRKPSSFCETAPTISSATHAMLTSLDWNPQSRVTNAIAGGSNAHYLETTRIIANAAAEFTVPQTTPPRMVRSHFRFLKAMGRAEQHALTLVYA